MTPSWAALAWREMAARPARIVIVNVFALALNPDMRVMTPWIMPKWATRRATRLSSFNAMSPSSAY